MLEDEDVEEPWICFASPECETLDCCCGAVAYGDIGCQEFVDLGPYEMYAIWLGSERAATGGADFNPRTFNYLTSEAAQADRWAGGVANTTRWSTAWLMPGYAKFFESESAERYVMRVHTFRGWSTTADINSTGWAKGTAKSYNRRIGSEITHFSWHTDNVGIHWNNISTLTAHDGNESRRSTLGMYTTDADGTRTKIFDVAKDNDTELKEIMHSGEFMLISRTTFWDQDMSSGDGAYSQMPWPLCYAWVTAGLLMGFRDGDLTSRLGLGAGNPRPMWNVVGTDRSDEIYERIDSSRRQYSPLYNPAELKGLIKRFGPSEYLRDTGGAYEWISGDGWVGGAGLGGDSSFVRDRRTRSRLRHWYGYYTAKISDDFEAAEASSPLFRKTKALAYKKSDLYALGREVEATTTATTSTSTAPTVASTPSSTTGGGGMTGGGGTGEY